MNRLKRGATTCHCARSPHGSGTCAGATSAQEGRAAQIRAKGYVGVEIKELRSEDEVADLYVSKKDTLVRRGDRGQEILCKMPLEAFNLVKRRQREKWNAGAKSAKKIRRNWRKRPAGNSATKPGRRFTTAAFRSKSHARTARSAAKRSWTRPMPETRLERARETCRSVSIRRRGRWSLVTPIARLLSVAAVLCVWRHEQLVHSSRMLAEGSIDARLLAEPDAGPRRLRAEEHV
jgi:hypothetical protein